MNKKLLLPNKAQLKEMEKQVPKELLLKNYTNIVTLQQIDDLAKDAIQIQIALEGVINLENEIIQRVKEYFSESKKKLELQKKTQEEIIVQYMAKNDADVFPKAKTRELHHITLTKKTSETIKHDVDKFAKETIELIKEVFPEKKDELIRVKEEIKATDFKKLSDDELKKVNAKREKNDNYNYKLKMDKPII